MPPLTSRAQCILRACPRQGQSFTPALAACQQRRTKADIADRAGGAYDQTPPDWQSPFKSKESNPTTRIPSFANYMSKKGETSNKTFQYFMVGSMGLLAAAGAKATVQGRSSEGSFAANYMLWGASAHPGFKTDIECHFRFSGQHVGVRRRARSSKS